MIDEKSKRKANFDERNSAPVVLADGQPWFVPKPWLEIRPVFRSGRATTAYPVLTWGAELDGLVEAMAEADDIWEQVTAVASLAAYLLRWHYELADRELDQLLAFRRADDRSLDWMKGIIAIATGRSGPKVWCAGGD
jgi:hypothetical protein